MSDDHAAHAIGAYGSRINQTPNIDRLASEGLVLRNVFATNSICTPSRAAILTGQYTHLNGVPVFNRFDSSRMTVAQLLQQGGYYTGMIGKWHLGSDPVGFDRWEILPGQGAYFDPMLYTATGEKTYRAYVTDVIDGPGDRLHEEPAARQAVLPDAPQQGAAPAVGTRREAPCAVRGSLDPRAGDVLGHLRDADGRAPREPPARRHRPDAPGSQARAPGGPQRSGAHQLAGGQAHGGDDHPGRKAGVADRRRAGPMEVPALHEGLPGDVQSVDDNVGRLLDFLDANGLAKNTIVIYTSDQGFFLGDHGMYDKRFMYEESLRMPFLVRWPAAIKPGTRSDAIALNVDFAPTFLEAAGLTVPADMQGRSLVPVLRGRTAGRLAQLDVLPLLPRPRPPQHARALRRPHPHAQADPFLEEGSVGAVRPHGRSVRAPQPLRPTGARTADSAA